MFHFFLDLGAPASMFRTLALLALFIAVALLLCLGALSPPLWRRSRWGSFTASVALALIVVPWFLIGRPAYADTSTTVAVVPLINDIAPYAMLLLPALVAWGVAEFRKATGVDISANAVTKLNALAKAEAGALIAASSTNLAGVAVPVGSPLIAGAANRIIAAAPGLLNDAGLSAASVATMIAGHVGEMQVSAPAATVAPLTVAAKA